MKNSQIKEVLRLFFSGKSASFERQLESKINIQHCDKEIILMYANLYYEFKSLGSGYNIRGLATFRIRNSGYIRARETRRVGTYYHRQITKTNIQGNIDRLPVIMAH